MDDWKKVRKAAAHHRRRIIFNNDGDDTSGGHVHDGIKKKDVTPQAFWEARSLGVENSHLDSIFYCTNAGSFNSHSHNSRVAELFTSSVPGLFPLNYSGALIEQGRDCLELIIDFCRKNGIEAFWSQRMNDIHDNWYPVFYSKYKKEHPELLLFRPEDIGKPMQGLVEPHMNATAVDYGKQEIRDQQYEIIRDVCQRYDVDGIELDFMRQPIFFRPTMEGRPVAQEQIDIMTDFLARVRAMTEQAGKDRGKPILIAVCVPNLPDVARNIGLDVEEWLKKDLIDIVIASLEHTCFTGSLGPMVKMKERYDVPVYARLSGSCGSIDRWAGAVTNAWRAGVDGIQTFNIFNPHWEGWRILGDPAVVAGMDKTFALDNKNHRTWDHVIEREGRLPAELSEGKSLALNLPVGDDIAGYIKSGKTPSLNMFIKIDRMTFSDKIEFRLNGRIFETEVYTVSEGISPVARGTFFLRATPEPKLLKQGDNKIEALLQKRCESAPGLPAITELSLTVKYSKQ